MLAFPKQRLWLPMRLGVEGWLQTAPQAGRRLSTWNFPFLHSISKLADVISLVATCLPPIPWDFAHPHLKIAQ